MKEFLPATAVMFFIGRILGGPDGERDKERNGQRERDGDKEEERWVDQRKKRGGKERDH